MLVVVVFVISDVELKREIRAQWDEFVELTVIANGPGHAAQKRDRDSQPGPGKPRRCLFAIASSIAIGRPRQQYEEKHSHGWVSEQRQAPKKAVETPVAQAE